MCSRVRTGSVVQDKRDKVWRFYWWENGKRRSKRIGTKAEYPTKSAAWKAAKPLRDAVENQKPLIAPPAPTAPTVNELVEQYRIEKMPKRRASRRVYEGWLKNHILPKWGDLPITAAQARPVELWLETLDLSPRSRSLVRGVLGCLWDYAQWRGDVPMQRNPMQLVTVKGCSKRTREPRSLTVEEFQQFAAKLGQPFDTIAKLSVCLGLRISEALALKWSDINWLDGTLTIQRAIVAQHTDDVKTEGSRKPLVIGPELLEVLKLWRQSTQFAEAEHWIFASPVRVGRLPWSYDQVRGMYQKAATAAGIGRLGTHTMRHTFRTWLDSTNTPLGVQQRMMRHANIATTLNIYGTAMRSDMTQAHEKIAQLALTARDNGTENT